MMKRIRNIIYILGALMFLVSCIQKPSPLLEQNIVDLKNKGICERVINGNPYFWPLVNKDFNGVIFDIANVALDNDKIVEGIKYKKSKSIRGFVSKPDVEKYQKDFNSLDRYFSTFFNEEGKYSQNSLNGATNSLISWKKGNYKVSICISIPYEPNKFILLELYISKSEFNENRFFFHFL